MEEFIENFQEFRSWLYNRYNQEFYSKDIIKPVIKKFEELGLNNAF